MLRCINYVMLNVCLTIPNSVSLGKMIIRLLEYAVVGIKWNDIFFKTQKSLF